MMCIVYYIKVGVYYNMYYVNIELCYGRSIFVCLGVM